MESISSIIYSIYRGTPRHDEWVVACLQGAWPKLVGERLAGICRPQILESSELHIEILDPTWEEALQGLTDDLVKKLRTATGGEVQSVRFTLRPCSKKAVIH